MLGNVICDKKGKIAQEPSSYQPDENVRELTLLVKQDFAQATEVMDTPYAEFNDMTLSQRMSEDQKLFNSYVKPKSDDPDRSWQWNGVRTLPRNKIISMAAHLTAQVLYPNVFAQNDMDEEDKMAASVMRDLIEWNIKNSDYEVTFLFAVITALVNPAVILDMEFSKVMQSVKTKQKNGEIGMKEVIDEFFSGLIINIVPCEELYINNIYEYEIQKQKCLIRRRMISYDTAKGKYGDHKNFDYVTPGIKIFYDDEHAMFYEESDDNHPTLVEELVYYNRREDMEVAFVNGVYLGDDDTKANMINHRRIVICNGEPVLIPVYKFIKSGYKPIDEKRFFYYKSAAFEIFPEADLLNSMYRITMDGSFLDTFPAMALFGAGKVNQSVIYPGAVTPFGDQSRLEAIRTGSNLNSSYSALSKLEESIKEATQSDVSSGQLPSESQTAWAVARSEQNARIQLGVFGKMLGRLVVEIGYHMIDIILNHQTIASIDEITGGDIKLKYKTFILPNQSVKGKKVTKRIEFTDEFTGKKYSEKQKDDMSFAIQKEAGDDSRLYKINPYLFARRKYLLNIEYDTLVPKNEAFEKAMKMEAYTMGRQDPFIEQEEWTREHLVGAFHKGDEEKYMKKAEDILAGKAPMPTPTGKPEQSKFLASMTKGRPLKEILAT